MRFHISSERAAGDCVWSSFLWTLGVFLPGFVPGLGFLPHWVQKQVGTEAHPTQSERNWKKILYTSAFVFMLYLLLTVMLWSRIRGAVGKTIHLIEFCCLHTCPISQNCYNLKMQALQWEDRPDQERHTGNHISICNFPSAQNSLHKQGGIYQNVSLLEHVSKAQTLIVKICGFRHRHNIGSASPTAFQGHQWSVGTQLPHPQSPGGSASLSKQISLWALGQIADIGYSRMHNGMFSLITISTLIITNSKVSLSNNTAHTTIRNSPRCECPHRPRQKVPTSRVQEKRTNRVSVKLPFLGMLPRFQQPT